LKYRSTLVLIIVKIVPPNFVVISLVTWVA